MKVEMKFSKDEVVEILKLHIKEIHPSIKATSIEVKEVDGMWEVNIDTDRVDSRTEIEKVIDTGKKKLDGVQNIIKWGLNKIS